MFIKMDKNGSGLINTDEFAAFIGELGVKIPRAELDHDTIGPDTVKGISFESRLRAGFLEADRDGSGSVSFKEFATCLMSSVDGQRSPCLLRQDGRVKNRRDRV